VPRRLPHDAGEPSSVSAFYTQILLKNTLSPANAITPVKIIDNLMGGAGAAPGTGTKAGDGLHRNLLIKQTMHW
jgi:hypothetical protein